MLEDTELRKNIEDYISSHSICTIAVADGSNPSAHTVYYISNGLHMYFASSPDSQKIHILRSNPKISLTIDEEYSDWREIKAIQLFGKAKLTDEEHAPRLQKDFLKKYPHIQDFGGIPQHHVFVEILPEKIYYMDFSNGFGSKKILYLEGLKSLLNW